MMLRTVEERPEPTIRPNPSRCSPTKALPTPPRTLASSPANDVSEALVHTVEYDYVQVMVLPDAASVLALISTQFEGYNNVAYTYG